MRAYPPKLNRPSWQWSLRDWRIFRAAHCGATKRHRELAEKIVPAIRGGARVQEFVVEGKISAKYIYLILSTQKLRDEFKMARFYEKRGNIGRPLDMGGLRDTWIETDLNDEGYPDG